MKKQPVARADRYRKLRDASLGVARSERAFGCTEAMCLLARDALKWHRMMRRELTKR